MPKSRVYVSRRYETDSEACERALTLLLRGTASKRKAAGVPSSNGDDAKKGSLKHEVRANTILPQ